MSQYLHRMLMLLASALCFSASAQVTYTANDINPAYTGKYRPGINLAYIPTWSPKQQGDLAAGNPALGIPGVGARSTRPGLFDTVLDEYGYGLNLGAFDYYRDLGMTELTAIVGFPSDRHRAWSDRHCNDPEKWNALFEGIYEPIWDDGANGTPYNDDNKYAAYLYEIVTLYTDHVRFWEVWNEPGLYKGNDSQVFWGEPDYPGSWWVNDPDPCDYSIHAPIEHFIRTLRISYEIIKTVSPDDYVSIAGVGSQSFLDALLRNSDNPDGGSITPEFPNLGGAYIDVLGFHTYPHLDGSTQFPPTGYFARHSDGAADGLIQRRLGGYQQVLYNYGYDGVTYPKKQHICTEINVPRRIFTGDYFGGQDEQINFIAKALVATKVNDVHQMHVYTISDKTTESSASFEFDLMGLYKKLDGIAPYNQQVNDQGIAYKTAADLIYPTEYDEAATQALNVPSGVRAYAFAKPDGNYVYAIWAETQIDLSEQASANFSFPARLNLNQLTRYEWNHSQTGQTQIQNANNIALNARPIYLVSGNPNIPNTAPVPTLSTSQTTVNSAFDVAIDFNEPVSGLSASDFTVSRARLASLSGTGSAYVARFEPTSQGAITISLPARAANDDLGLASVASNVLTLTSTTDGSTNPSRDTDLELVLTADKQTVGLNENIKFTLVARNAGMRQATGVLIEFAMPDDYSFVGVETSIGGYAPWTGNWQLGTLDAGQTAVMELELYVLKTDIRTAYAQVIGVAQFDSDSTPANGSCCTANEDDEAAITINGSQPPIQEADLSISLTSPQAAVAQDGSFDFALTVYNDGPHATSGVKIQLDLPAGIITTGANIPGGTLLSNAVWTVNRLNVGQTQTLSLSLRSPNPTSGAVLIAEIIASDRVDPDSQPGNGSAGEDDRGVLVLDGAAPAPLGDASLTLMADTDYYEKYSHIGFTLELNNSGTQSIQDVEIHFPLSPGLSYGRYNASHGNFNLAVDSWRIPNLEPGETASLFVTEYASTATRNITAFAQVVAMIGGDSDSSPNNRLCCTPLEDDEAALTIQPRVVTLPPTKNNNPGPGVNSPDQPELELAESVADFTFHRLQRDAGSGNFSVNFTSNMPSTAGVLLDGLGRQLRKVSLAEQTGTFATPLNMQDLAAGTYTLLINTPTGAVPVRIVHVN